MKYESAVKETRITLALCEEMLLEIFPERKKAANDNYRNIFIDDAYMEDEYDY